MIKSSAYIMLCMMSVSCIFLLVEQQAYAKGAPAPRPSAESGLYAKMLYDDLKKLKPMIIANGNDAAIGACLERLVKVCNVADELSDLLIELSDHYFKVGSFAKAMAIYGQFSSYYPGHKQAKYARFRTILAGFNNINKADRDQTKTEEVVALAEVFLKQPVNTEYYVEVSEIRDKALERLFDAEVSICMSYVTRKDFIAAYSRLEYIRNKLVSKMPTLEPRLLALEGDVAEKTGNYQLVMAKRLQLHEQYPEQEILIQARKDEQNSYSSWLKVWA